jgi:CRISPR-associated protein Cas4
MKKGQDYHQEKVRRKQQSVLENKIITYNKFLTAPNLGLYALFDAIVKEEPNTYYPIEFKSGKIRQEIPLHHQIQLIIQALILEDTYDVEVTKGEIRYEGKKQLELTISLEMKDWVLKQQTQMIEVVLQEQLPQPTRHIGKCMDCEYWIECQRA